MNAAPALELLPCPFCGGRQTIVQEGIKPFPRLNYRQPESVTVTHRCTPSNGLLTCAISFAARDRASAIAAWNRRSAPEQPSLWSEESTPQNSD
ncbi:TPA: Lar family restriction alleviation protein [Neisseria meningitidis]|uniref:Lar family restriction alleviation protein n=1 Tax=Delftia acidovorans TaxID=80866 RepID=UPI0035F7CEEB